METDETDRTDSESPPTQDPLEDTCAGTGAPRLKPRIRVVPGDIHLIVDAAERVLTGRRFVRAGGRRSAEAWWVESVSSVSSASGAPTAANAGGDIGEDVAYARASHGA